MAPIIQRVMDLARSVRFREEPSGIVADAELSMEGLVELMHLGVPAFVNYTRRSKLTEAHSMLRYLFTAVATSYAANGTLPGSAGPIPPAPSAETQLGNFSADPTFQGLGFSPTDPLYYSYSIVATDDPNVVVLRAEGDLDGDGERSRIELTVTCEPVNGCRRSEEFLEESPLE